MILQCKKDGPHCHSLQFLVLAHRLNNIFEHMKINNFFFTDSVSGVRNFQCLCSGSVCCLRGLNCLSSWLLFMVLICEMFQTLILEYCCYF